MEAPGKAATWFIFLIVFLQLKTFSARPAWSSSSAGQHHHQDGKALQWASEEMKGDRELCMAAVTQDGKTLQWASEEMKGDRDVCMAAVAQLAEVAARGNKNTKELARLMERCLTR